ncbi:MAG TPA: hypothetical protein VFS54_10440 [Solirubrobacterales bacterium]|nr:hypothetical protein [Solirubrobacterales bacterium]
MRRILLVLALLTTGVPLLLAGCGGSSEAEEKTLTKKQFVELTEAFCDKESRAEERDMEAYADKHLLLFGGGEPWEQEILNEIVLEYVEDKIDYFKSLPVPEGDGKEIKGMIAAFEEGLEKSEKEPAGLAEPRPFAKKEPPSGFWDASYETTSTYGPWLCGQP